jgi:hypothetical protein
MICHTRVIIKGKHDWSSVNVIIFVAGIGLWVNAACGAALGQEANGAAKKLIIPLGEIRTIQTKKGNGPVRVQIDNDKIVSDKSESKMKLDSVAYLEGLALGTTKVVVTDALNNREIWQVSVRREMSMPAGASFRLPSPDSRPLKRVVNDNEKVLRARIAPDDAKFVQLESLAIGTAQLTLTSQDDRVEKVHVSVKHFDYVFPEKQMCVIHMTMAGEWEVIRAVRILHDKRIRYTHSGMGPGELYTEGLSPGPAALILESTENTIQMLDIWINPAR